MAFAYFTLFVALVISAVAEFYSIVGLTAIFSAAFWPVVIMGAALGIGKITAAVWLKLNWERASWTYKLYLVPAVGFLMLLTSMGIFGFLSKAHSDQSLISGDVVAKISVYDEKIKIERENIDANRKALKQLDEAVDQTMGRSTTETGADRAVQIRRSQQKERSRLQQEIAESQKRIAVFNEERAPIAAEVRKVEAEVGPIKYIAALVYGDDPDANLLEAAVRWVIILIVAVFDPLALVLILAAQQSLRWAKEEPKVVEPDWQQRTDELLEVFKDQPTELDPEPVKSTPMRFVDYGEHPRDYDETLPEEPEAQPVAEPEKSILEQHPYLTQGFPHFKDLEPMVYKPEHTNQVPTQDLADDDTDEEHPDIKAAMVRWKEANPGQTLKEQRHKLLRGEITELPWMHLVEPTEPNSGFGTEFPKSANKGDTYVRVDRLPNQVYKFNGNSWILVDKTTNDSYTYNEAYLDHLIAKIDSGEYDVDLLSTNEQEQISHRLQTKNI